MTIAIIVMSALAVIGALVGVVFYQAKQLRTAHGDASLAYIAHNEVVRSNFELQHQVTRWKTSHEEVTRAFVDKEQELNRAVAARKILDKRMSEMVLRMAEGAPLDDLTAELQRHLDELHKQSLPLPPPEAETENKS